MRKLLGTFMIVPFLAFWLASGCSLFHDQPAPEPPAVTEAAPARVPTAKPRSMHPKAVVQRRVKTKPPVLPAPKELPRAAPGGRQLI